MLTRPFALHYSKRLLPNLFMPKRNFAEGVFHTLLNQHDTTRLILVSVDKKRKIEIAQGKSEIKNLFHPNSSLHSQFEDTLEFRFSHHSEQVTISISKKTIQAALNQSQQNTQGKTHVTLSQLALKTDLITSMLFGAQHDKYEIALTFDKKNSLEAIQISQNKKIVFSSKNLITFSEKKEENAAKRIAKF